MTCHGRRDAHGHHHMSSTLMASVSAIGLAGAAVAYFYRHRRGSDGSSSYLADVATGQTHHPSALRNRIPILKTLLKVLPDSDSFSGLALEIASGTGALMEVVAPAYPLLTYQPSEFVPEVAAAPAEQWSTYGKIGLRHGLDELANIDGHGSQIFANCLPAVALDLLKTWPAAVTDKPRGFALILVANTLHCTPWECSVSLLRGAADALASDGHLVVYGPFKVGGAFLGADGGAGNASFDAKLRDNNATWGLRDVEELASLAIGFGLALRDRAEMPSNNLLLHFVRRA